MNCGEADGGGGVPADGLSQDAFAGGSGQLFLDRGGLLGIGDGPDMLPRDKVKQALHGLLEHRLFSNNVQKLLGCASPAARPEARPTPSRHDYGVYLEFFVSHFAEKNLTQCTLSMERTQGPK